MKRRWERSTPSKVDSLPPCKISSFSSSSISQQNLMHYLGLKKKVNQVQLKACCVVIQGIACKICKRLFKCKSDIKKHLNKKHEYLKRKKDNKLVRILLKLGNETFRDDKINQKYLVPPDAEFEKIQKSHKIDKSQRSMEVSQILVSKEVPANTSKDLRQIGSVSLTSVMEDMKSIKGASCNYNKGETSNSSPIIKRENLEIPVNLVPGDLEYYPTWTHDRIDTIVYDTEDVDFENLYEDVTPDISKIKEEEDSDDGEIVILHDACRYPFQSVQRRIEQPKNAEAVEDISFVNSVASFGSLERMVSNPMKMQQMESHQMVSVAELPNKQNPIDIEAIDYENGDISDAETVIFDVNDRDDINLCTATNFQLKAEETYNISVDEQMPALTNSQADSDIYIIEDDEPIKVVEQNKVVEPTKDVELTKVIQHFEHKKPLVFSQMALMETLHVISRCMQSSSTADSRTNSQDKKNNEGVSTSDANVLHNEEAFKCLVGLIEQACQVISNII